MTELSNYLPKVFVSHSWQDKRQAVEMTDGLRELKCANVWLDFEDMSAGAPIAESIQNVLADMDYMLLVWTSNSKDNENIKDEITWATELGIPIIACHFEFDKNNAAVPELPEQLKKNINVEFRNMHSGLLSLFDTFKKFFMPNLPDVIQEEYSPKMDVSKRVIILNNYLINFNKVKGNADDRTFWIRKIMVVLEDLSADPSYKEMVYQFINELSSLKETDPQAYEAILPFLKKFNTPKALKFSVSEELNNPSSDSRIEQIRKRFIEMTEMENSDNLTFLLLEPAMGGFTAEQIYDLIQLTINRIGGTISLLEITNQKANELQKKEVFTPIFEYLTDYFLQIDDVRADSMGALGWMDDCYLCLVSLNKLNILYAKEFNTKLVDLDLDEVIENFKPYLTAEELQKLDAMAESKFDSIDWGTIILGLAGVALGAILLGAFFNSFGNQNTASNQSSNDGGGYIEDRMARSAAALGIPFNY